MCRCDEMLITLCYAYLWIRFQRFYTAVIRSALHRLRHTHSSVTFSALTHEHTSRNSHSTHTSRNLHSTHISHTVSNSPALLLQRGDKGIYISEPQACVDLSKWTVLLGSSRVCAPRLENIAFIIEASSSSSEQTAGRSSHRTDAKVVTWSDFCLPLACSPGQPYRAVAEASLENFSQLGVAFLEDRLQMENGLIPERIVSVLLRESELKELFEKQQSDGRKRLNSKCLGQKTEIVSSAASPSEEEVGDVQQIQSINGRHLPDRQDPDTQSCGAERRPADEPENTPEHTHTPEHHHMEGHHLHLSSCHECLELENSTILSVKFASVENIPDLPDDYAPADHEEDEESESRRVNVSGKPPNVLVFTGGCEEQYRRVHSLLEECIDTDSYTIYPLRPQQALSDPWLENALLLVIATDQTLTPQLQLRFLSYLSQGGRVLGLSSTLCPAGLTLQSRHTQKDHICTMNFTKSDSTELQLSVLASGRVFVREPRDSGGGEVELWGELTGQEEREMVIVRVTHGADSGEAVLCQVRLETAPDSDLSQGSAGFSELKMSNARRYEVLTEILTSLGLSCELSQVPPASPFYLLTTHTERSSRFLQWLKQQVDGDAGVLKTQSARIRVVCGSDGPVDQSAEELLLYTDPPEKFSEHFSFHTYQQNLQSQRLGHTLIYCDVTSSTMDLLQGLMLQLPEETSLISIAARQTKGKGRSGNVWLSPLGCAMFSLQLQVPVGSRLGQRISFLQHLAALAAVESVRTLPGYEDIDLRVKWPNDIYYSDLMKLGGVLVNSTIMGSTFHLLIGCGFNVSNSNPTICINDLIRQHNREHGSRLQTLSAAALIARSVSLLENFISDFQQHGPQAVLPLYYRRWVHSNTRVRLWSEDGPEAQVIGLDDNGFLQVDSGQGLISVQPDGNSFDMLRNLVVTKHS